MSHEDNYFKHQLYLDETREELEAFVQTLPLPEGMEWEYYIGDPAVRLQEKTEWGDTQRVGWITTGRKGEVFGWLCNSETRIDFSEEREPITMEARKAALRWLSTALLLGER
jgi:hypothetical protein